MKKTAFVLALVLCLSSLCLSGALAEDVVNIYNWYDYMDDSVLEDFTAETALDFF